MHVLPIKVQNEGRFDFNVEIHNASESDKFGDTRIYAIMSKENGLEFDYAYMEGVFETDQQDTSISLNFQKDTQYYLIVEHDWLKDTQEKTMTIACTRGTQKIELEDEKDMAKSLKNTASG